MSAGRNVASFRFELVVYRPRGSGERVMSAADYASARERGEASWDVNLDHSSLRLEQDGRVYICADWNLGRADWLEPQLEAAADRIDRGDVALLRSAVLDGGDVPFYSFEPASDVVAVSEFEIPDRDVATIFPAGQWASRSAELYRHFDDHRDQLLAPLPPEAAGDTEHFRRLRVPRRELCTAMRQAANDARRLFALPGLSPPRW